MAAPILAGIAMLATAEATNVIICGHDNEDCRPITSGELALAIVPWVMIPFCACLGFVAYASMRAWVRAFAARSLRGHEHLPDSLSRRAGPDQDIHMPDLPSIRRQSSERLPDTHPAPSVVNVARQPSLEMRSSTPRTAAAPPDAAASSAAADAAADAPAAARDPNATTWACPACTYTNPVSEAQCGMCQSDRP